MFGGAGVQLKVDAMKKKLGLLLAAALAAETLIVGVAPSSAAPLRVNPASYEQAPLVSEVNHRRRHWGGRRGNNAAAAIIGGLAAGAILGLAARPRYHDYYYDDYYYDEPRYIYPRVAPRRYYRSGGLDAHQAWCLDRWRSYDLRSDTYQPSHGRRRYCNSPYN